MCYDRQITIGPNPGDTTVILNCRPPERMRQELREECQQGLLALQRRLQEEAKERAQARDSYKTCQKHIADLSAYGVNADRQAENLRAELAPRPGVAELAAFPKGASSGPIAFFGGCALPVGFALGLPGRQGKRLPAALVAGLFTLLIYIGFVALLPDTRPVHLLLAMTGAVFLCSLRTLLRAYVLVGQYRSAAHPHP